MIATILAIVSGLISCAIGIWKYCGRKSKEKRERISNADAQFQEGVKERDPRKIISANDRLNNDV